MSQFTVQIEGNIGGGKSTFLERFRKQENFTVLEEPVEKWKNFKGHNLLDLAYKFGDK
jgi:deoxyadenosine/deoxycytidine kinase